MRQRLILAGWVALLAVACGSGIGGVTRSPEQRSPEGSTGTANMPSEAAATNAASPAVFETVPRCEQIERISAAPEWYRDSPIYVANEQPVEDVRAWARTKPGFEELWLDRDHLGWITLAFSVDAEARQAELQELFPDVGVVAVAVDWTMAELQDLQRRVTEELSTVFSSFSSGISVTQGVVTIGVGVLKGDRVAAVEERFAGERVCIEGTDLEDAPADGPQASEGDGWRLLADQPGAGEAYRTGIASGEASYRQLWAEVGFSGERPAVDFHSEVVIWFGAVYGSSCPDLRLDEVVVDRDHALVHAQIVLVDPPVACTEDANPRAYLVALERAQLPSGPFAIQLDADGPPAGAPERTVVDVDLSEPGAVASIDQVHADPTLPEPFVLEAGSFIEPEIRYPYRLSVHCGVEWLGSFNDVAWRTDVPDGAIDYVPPKWHAAVEDETVELTIVLHTDPEPRITATAAGHSITYRPSLDAPPGCD